MYNTILLDNLLNSFAYGIFDDYKTDTIYGQSKIENKDDGYYLHIPVPGLTKDDLRMTVKENYLTITHESKEDKKQKSFFVGNFKKMYKIPKDADEDKIKASISNGICTIKIPKNKEKITEKLITIS